MVGYDQETPLDRYIRAFPSAREDEENEIIIRVLHEIDGLIYHRAYGVLKNEQDARDVQQRIRIKIAIKLKRAEIASKPELIRFVERATTNLAIDELRAIMRRKKREEEAGENAIGEARETDPNPADPKQELLSKVLAKLSKKSRAVLIAVFQGDEVYRRFGAKFGHTLFALQKRKSRAIKEAREIYEELKAHVK